ncbi:unnamed protein product [Camellia sinensis]
MEAKIAGPVQYRWMYFIERYLMTLKSYMCNRSHPEGSIAQGYLVEECMTFCSRYLHDVESKLHRPLRNCDVSDNPEILMGRALGKGKGEHREFIKRSHRRLRDYDVDRRHNDEFPKWFNSYVAELLATENVALSEEIKILALGPSQKATRFNGYIINGTRYHTKSCELRRKTQNSGVMVKAKTSSYASAKDINPVEGDVAYYGYVTDIIELYYSHDHRYMLFMCNWIDNNKGLKQDDFGFTLVNFNHLLYAKKQDSDEPFILASQAQQVFYVNDSVDEDWNVVLKMKPRDLYEVCGEQPTIDEGLHHNEVEGFGDQELDVASFTCEEDMDWVRQGIDGTTVDETIGPLEASTEAQFEDDEELESEQSSSNSSSSDETQTTLKMKVIPNPPASWHPPGSLPTTSRSGSTSHGSVSAGPSSSQATQKQTRGPTYVHGQWGTSEDGILKVVPNELHQVVEGHTSLASHLGVLARDGSLAPLTFTTWHYVPKQNKDNIWRQIKAHTDADESMKRTIMASFGKKWRDWKSRVKIMGYKPFKNDAERLAHRPDRVHEDQWRALVYYWGTQSASKSSKKNRKIRKKKTLHHRTGRKPFSVVRLEETKKNNGVMTQMNELAEHMEGSSTDPAALQEQIFTQVMGPERPGRVRTFGLGPSPTDVFGGGYRRSQEQNRLFQTQVQEQVQEQLQRYQMQFESKMNEVMEKQIQAIRTNFQSRIQFLESQLQAAGVPVDPVVAPSNSLHRQQVVDSLSSHPTVRPMSHQQQSHAFSSQEVIIGGRGGGGGVAFAAAPVGGGGAPAAEAPLAEEKKEEKEESEDEDMGFLQTKEIQVSQENPSNIPDMEKQFLGNQHQHSVLEKLNTKCTKGSQPECQVRVQFAELLKSIIPQVDNERATQLHKLFFRLRDIVGCQLLTEAVKKVQIQERLVEMGHFSSLFNGLAQSFSIKNGRNSGYCGESESAESMVKESKKNELILRSSGTVHVNGSNNFASVFSKRGEKGVNQDCFIVWEVVDLVRRAVPLAVTSEDDPRREVLKKLQEKKEEIDMLAHK